MMHTLTSVPVNMSAIHMLKGQLMTNGMHDDTILNVLATINRSHFVPKKFSHAAYADDDIMLCGGRFLLEPLVFARMLHALEIEPHHVVMEIGAGLGYGAAVLSRLCKHVIAVEDNAELVSQARKRLADANCDNVDLITAPLLSGCDSHKPYDRIIIEGAIHNVPKELEDQLKEGGLIVAIRAIQPPFATKKALSQIIIGQKKQNSITYIERERLCAYPLHELEQDTVIRL